MTIHTSAPKMMIHTSAPKTLKMMMQAPVGRATNHPTMPSNCNIAQMERKNTILMICTFVVYDTHITCMYIRTDLMNL